MLSCEICNLVAASVSGYLVSRFLGSKLVTGFFPADFYLLKPTMERPEQFMRFVES